MIDYSAALNTLESDSCRVKSLEDENVANENIPRERKKSIDNPLISPDKTKEKSNLSEWHCASNFLEFSIQLETEPGVGH
ncbi:hypothetical protein RUM44_005234 [Polyplax serrata]|uniref:Uncharacterized protein n=1 Tax=Polyplax serrata TaxID=468196 RepID=A0ABR1AEH3_POLSC